MSRRAGVPALRDVRQFSQGTVAQRARRKDGKVTTPVYTPAMWASALVSLAPMRRLTFPDQQQTQHVTYKTNVTGALRERGTDGDVGTDGQRIIADALMLKQTKSFAPAATLPPEK